MAGRALGVALGTATATGWPSWIRSGEAVGLGASFPISIFFPISFPISVFFPISILNGEALDFALATRGYSGVADFRAD
jgi:hypothetical protein